MAPAGSRDELLTALATIFQVKGTSRLPRRTMVMAMSMELRWFTPAGAEAVIDAGVSSGLLGVDGEDVIPAFEPDDVEAPVDFRPSESLARTGSPGGGAAQPGQSSPSGGGAKAPSAPTAQEDLNGQGLLMTLVDEIARATESSRREVFGKVNAWVVDRGYTPEVAALIVGAESEVDLRAYHERVLETLQPQK